jgi:shikimate dehydrogenase
MRLSGKTEVVGVFGWPVRHSLSPPMHQAAFEALGLDWVYVPFAVPPQYFAQAARALPALGLVGANCTIPHKEAAATLVDEIDPEARAIGAVNTLTVLDDGRLHGMNTDADGFLDSLRVEGGLTPQGKTVSLVGTGGAGRAMAFGLARGGAERLFLINRTLEKAQHLANDLGRFGATCPIEVVERGSKRESDVLGQSVLLVNSTSLGLRPGDALPADPGLLPDGAAVYDAVYTPLETPLLKAAATRGLATVPGLGMLARQGAFSFEHWTRQEPDVDLMISVLKRELGY